jgi:hypothetical protein
MRVARRLSGCVFGAAGATGLVLCVAGLVACWVTYVEVVRRVDRLFGRADDALAEISGNLGRAGDRLRGAQAELDAVRRRESEPAAHPPVERSARRAISRKAVEAIGPQADEARSLLVKATDAALVANGLLDALAELPVVERLSVDTDRLKETSAQLADVSARTGRLASLLAPSASGPDADAGMEASRAAEALGRAIALTGTGTERLEPARERITAGHARAVRWATGVAVTVTVVLLWIAAGQLSLLIHGRALARR